MRLASVTLVLLILLSLVGCARVILRPIDKVDLVPLTLGQPYTPEKQGWFVSDVYMEEIGVAVKK